MASYKDGISPKIRTMVKKINEVGVNDITRYCDKYRPKTNIRRQMKIVRSVAKLGYTYASMELGMSRQGAEQALKRIYGIALEVEKLNDGKRKAAD